MNCQIFSARKFNYVNNHFSHRHKHFYYEINFYLHGSGETVINDNKYTFSTNSFSLIPPGVYHNETFKTSGTVICIMFECTNPHFAPKEFCGSYNEDNPLSFYADQIFKEMSENKPNCVYISNQLIKICVNEIQRIMDDETEKFCDSLFDAKVYINECFFKKIDFRMLANKAGYSYDYFRHIFKREFGLSPQNYLMKVRLENAHDMLSSTHGISITEIADTCGFSDVSQFSSMFTNHYGISPKKFQLNKRAENK